MLVAGRPPPVLNGASQSDCRSAPKASIASGVGGQSMGNVRTNPPTHCWTSRLDDSASGVTAGNGSTDQSGMSPHNATMPPSATSVGLADVGAGWTCRRLDPEPLVQEIGRLVRRPQPHRPEAQPVLMTLDAARRRIGLEHGRMPDRQGRAEMLESSTLSSRTMVMRRAPSIAMSSSATARPR